MSDYQGQRPQTYPGGYFPVQTNGSEDTQYPQPQGQPYYGQPQYAPQQPYAPQAPAQYYAPQPAAQPPVVVNVTQNNGGVLVRRKAHNGWHLLATLMTGGLWAPIWWLSARSARKIYYR